MPLTIEIYTDNIRTVCYKISGFSEKEISELNSMDYREMKSVINAAVRHWADNVPACFVPNAEKILSAWTRDDAVFVEVRKEA